MVEGGAADKEQLQTLLAADRLRYMIEGVGEADKDQLQTMLAVDRLWYMIGDILSCFYGIVTVTRPEKNVILFLMCGYRNYYDKYSASMASALFPVAQNAAVGFLSFYTGGIRPFCLYLLKSEQSDFFVYQV